EGGGGRERLDADDLLLLVAHRPRDVHHVDDDGVRLRQRLALPAPVALVVADRDDERLLGVVDAHRDLPLQRLLEGAAEVAKRFRTGAPHPDRPVLLGDDAFLALRLDVWELELLAEDGGELLHRHLDLEQVIAGPIAGLPGPRLGLALAERVAGIAVALPHSARLLRPVAEMRDVDLRQRNRYQLLAALAEH